MEIIITIQHPAHVHFFKNPIAILQESGHDVSVFVKESDIIVELLSQFGIDHEVITQNRGSMLGLVRSQLAYEIGIIQRVRERDPDILMAIGEPAITQTSTLFDCESFLFMDSEPSRVHKFFTLPFADRVFTPESHRYDHGDKHVRYPGYHELSYLHPDRFEPDPETLTEYGIDPDDEYYVVRFISWEAHHDVNQSGLSSETKERLVSMLSDYGDVFVTCEGDLPDEFETYQQPIPPHLIHDLLYYADMYIGDSQTMATEAAILGTPAIRSNSFAGDGDMSNFQELENEYDLLRSTPDEDEALQLAEQWAESADNSRKWQQRREKLFEDKIDVASFVVDAVEEENQQ